MNHDDRLQIGAFGDLVGLSVPQLRRYDRLGLLEPHGRSESGYRYYDTGQSGAGRAIALLRSMDMPIADIRAVLDGADPDRRSSIFQTHRQRLEARLRETRRLLDAVDAHTDAHIDASTKGHDMTDTDTDTGTRTDLSAWLHVMPRLPVSDLNRSVEFCEDVLGLRAAWRTRDGLLAAIASGEVEIFLLTRWSGDGPPPPQSAYVYVEDPDALCTEYELTGATIADPVTSRTNGMRDFVIVDPDGHRFTLGRGEASLRDVAAEYGLTDAEIVVDPDWLDARR